MHRVAALASLGLFTCVAAFTWMQLTRGLRWFDSGMLAHTAERVLQGQLPHRDFDAVYTGGLEFLHAAAMYVFGMDVRSPRIVLFMAFLAWIGLVYRMARTCLGPYGATWAAVAAALVSVPQYPEAMPSWYNLFLATAAGLALFQWLDTRDRRSLLAIGLLTGVSALTKITGIFTLAAALWLVALLHPRPSRAGPEPRRRWTVVGLVLEAGLWLAPTASVAVLVSPRAVPQDWIHFVLPVTLVTASGLMLRWRQTGRWTTAHPPETMRAVGVVVAGFIAPILVFILPYAFSGSLGSLIRGVFVAPGHRLDWPGISHPPGGTQATLVGLAAWAPVAIEALLRDRWRAGHLTLWIVGIAAWIAVAGLRPLALVFNEAAQSAGLALSLTMLAVVWRAGGQPTQAREPDTAVAHTEAARLSLESNIHFLILATLAVWLSLVRFPSAFTTYAYYFLPLAAMAWASWPKRGPRPALLTLSVLFVAYATLYSYRTHANENLPSGLTRASVRVSGEARASYGALMRTLGERTAPGDTILAFPDASEVYFLSARTNPTRTLYDFLGDNAPEKERQLLGWATRGTIDAVVIREGFTWSPRPSQAFLDEMRRILPRADTIPGFEVLFR